ncbi:MAG: hypothetical protein IJX41_09480 [Bacteroidaceae bacterium]|nr:hypothetical protein [Bacteroidaceae bacterium]
MRDKLDKLLYFTSTLVYALLALLFLAVFITSLAKNAIDMWVRIGWDWKHAGSYVGLLAGFVTYIILAITLTTFRIGHNLKWLMKFTHELTHTLVALLLFKKISEFVVKGRECYVNYKVGKYGIGYTPITLSPYCIPIYTFMIFPFRFAGDFNYLIFFDALIAFTYAFHLHSFIKQTRFTQSDIRNCGIARSVSFITLTHLVVASVILATPKGGVIKALGRVFCEYPAQILTNPSGWMEEIIKYF